MAIFAANVSAERGMVRQSDRTLPRFFMLGHQTHSNTRACRASIGMLRQAPESYEPVSARIHRRHVRHSIGGAEAGPIAGPGYLEALCTPGRISGFRPGKHPALVRHARAYARYEFASMLSSLGMAILKYVPVCVQTNLLK